MPDSQPSQREFRIRLFGGPTLQRKGHREHLSPFHGLLLSILAYHGRRGIRRERLISFLWSAGSEGVLRRRLSQMIYSLHQRLGTSELVTSDMDRFFLDVDRVEPDLERFHTALQQREVENALRMVSLGFLSEVNPIPTHDLEVWIEERDRQFRADIRSTAARLWAESEQRGDWQRAATLGRVLLELDPHDETGLRKVVRALGLTGKVSEGRAVYTEFSERMMAQDPGWAPEEETEALVARLDTLARERGPTFLVGQYGLPNNPPLVGREDELATLGRLLRDPADNEVLTIGLVGEPGVGKTRLAWEALRTLPFDGVRVLSARCSEFERRIPLSPLTSALKPGWVSEEARKLEDPWRAVLLGVFPEWHRGPEPPPAVPQIEPSEIPRRLCEAFRRLFVNLTKTDPLVLFIDDFHWVDETSLSVLDYIRQRGVEGDFRILVAIDDGTEGVTSGEPRSMGPMRWLNSVRRTVRLALHRLTEEQALTLAAEALAATGHDLQPEEAVRLGGRNALVLTEVINNWPLVREAGSKGIARLPASLHQVVVEPLDALAQPDRTVLNLLCVAMRPVPARELIDHLRAELGSEAEAALSRLVASRLVELGGLGFHPSSHILALTVRTLMSPTERIDLNRRYSAGLLGQDREPAVQAHYARECQDFDGAAVAFAQAADTAWEAGAAGDAVHFLSQAFECAPDGGHRLEALARLSEGLVRARMLTEAIPSLARSEEALRDAGAIGPSLKHRVLRLACHVNDATGDGRRAVSDLWETVDEAIGAGYPEAAALGLGFLARSSFGEVDARGMERVLRSARALMEEATDPTVTVQLLLVLSLQGLVGECTEGLRAARRAATYDRNVIGVTLRVSALNRLIILLGAQGLLNSPEGRDALGEASRLAKKTGDLRERCQPMINVGVWQLVSGEYQESLETFALVSREVRAVPDPELQARVQCNKGIAHLRLGDADSALASLRAAQSLLPALPPREGAIRVLAGMGWAHLLAGRLSKAAQFLEQTGPNNDERYLDPAILAGFRAQFEARRRNYDTANEVLREAASMAKDRFPMSWLDLVVQRLELLGSRIGPRAWGSDIAEAEEFCIERGLTARSQSLAWAKRRAER